MQPKRADMHLLTKLEVIVKRGQGIRASEPRNRGLESRVYFPRFITRIRSLSGVVLRTRWTPKLSRCEQTSVQAGSTMAGNIEIKCLSCKPVLLFITPDVERWQPRLTVLVVLFLVG